MSGENLNSLQQDNTITQFYHKYPNEASILTQVYQDLTIAKSWAVKVEESEMLERCFFKAKIQKESQYQVILPCSSLETWSVERLSNVLRSIPPIQEECSQFCKSVTLAITFPDSTIVYYKVNRGMIS
ncbi:hypothetical protein G9A89_013438 [Geosiphon pyriformis]|nr:hypothetical protein G9A89_013438 [Geosiphon pyriformis]